MNYTNNIVVIEIRYDSHPTKILFPNLLVKIVIFS